MHSPDFFLNYLLIALKVACVGCVGLEKLDAALSERSHIPTNKNKPARFHYAPPEYIFSGNNPLLLYPLESYTNF